MDESQQLTLSTSEKDNKQKVRQSHSMVKKPPSVMIQRRTTTQADPLFESDGNKSDLVYPRFFFNERMTHTHMKGASRVAIHLAARQRLAMERRGGGRNKMWLCVLPDERRGQSVPSSVAGAPGFDAHPTSSVDGPI